MLPLLLATSLALASEALAPAPDAAATLVDAAAALAAQGQPEAARAALDLALREGLPPDQQARAEQLRRALPMARGQLDAMTQLAVGQAVIGSYLAGPHLARISYDPARSATPYYLGALGGAALGAGGGILLGSRPGFDLGESRTMLTAEVLGGLTGATVGLVVDEYDQKGPAWGTLAGVGAGVGVGLWAASTDPSPTAAFAAQSGALWGTGLATAGIVFVEGGQQPEGVLVPLTVGADVGAVLGALAAGPLGLTTRQLAFADLGLGLGVGAGLLVVGIASAEDDVSPKAGATLCTLTGVTGGVLAAWLTDPDRGGGAGHARRIAATPVAHAALTGQPGALRLALPLPAVTPSPAGTDVDVHVVDLRF